MKISKLLSSYSSGYLYGNPKATTIDIIQDNAYNNIEITPPPKPKDLL